MALNVQLWDTLDNKTRLVLEKAIEYYTKTYSIPSGTIYKCLLSSLRHKKYFKRYIKHLITYFRLPRLSVVFTLNYEDYNTVYCKFLTDIINNSRQNHYNLKQIQIYTSNGVFINTLMDSNNKLKSFSKFFMKRLLRSLTKDIKVIDKNVKHHYTEEFLKDIISKYCQFLDLPKNFHNISRDNNPMEILCWLKYKDCNTNYNNTFVVLKCVNENNLSVYAIVHDSITSDKILTKLLWIAQYYKFFDRNIKLPDNYRMKLLLIINNIILQLQPKLKYGQQASSKTYQHEVKKNDYSSIYQVPLTLIHISNSHLYKNNTILVNQISQMLRNYFETTCLFMELFCVNTLQYNLDRYHGKNKQNDDIILTWYKKFVVNLEPIMLALQNSRRLLSDMEARNNLIICRLIEQKHLRTYYSNEKYNGLNYNELTIYKKNEKVNLHFMPTTDCIILVNSNLTICLSQEMFYMFLKLCNNLTIYEHRVYLSLNMNQEIEFNSHRQCECENDENTVNSVKSESNSIPKLVENILNDINYWLKWSAELLIKNINNNNCKVVILLHNFLEKIVQNLNEIETFNDKYFYEIGSAIIQLIKNLIIFQSNVIKEFSNKIFLLACEIWNHESIKMALSKYYTCDDKTLFSQYQKNDVENGYQIEIDNMKQQKRRLINIRCSLVISNELISVDFIKHLEEKNNTSGFDLYADLLILITKEFHIVTIDHLNDMFLKIFSYEWQTSTYSVISKLLNRIASERKFILNKSFYDGDDDDIIDTDSSDLEKSLLFMDLLSDLSRDIDI